jgi:hypothetical protein
MATNNFHYVNASYAFVVCDRQDNLEEGEDLFYDFDEELDNLRECIKHDADLHKIGLKSPSKDRHELRSYPSTPLYDVVKHLNVHGVEASIHITMIVRQGYYSSACLDWQIAVNVGDSLLEDTEMVSTEDLDEDVSNKREVVKHINGQIDSLIANVEDIFRKVSTPYQLLGTASNGEAFYKKNDI